MSKDLQAHTIMTIEPSFAEQMGLARKRWGILMAIADGASKVTLAGDPGVIDILGEIPPGGEPVEVAPDGFELRREGWVADWIEADASQPLGVRDIPGAPEWVSAAS